MNKTTAPATVDDGRADALGVAVVTAAGLFERPEAAAAAERMTKSARMASAVIDRHAPTPEAARLARVHLVDLARRLSRGSMTPAQAARAVDELARLVKGGQIPAPVRTESTPRRRGVGGRSIGRQQRKRA